MNKIGIDLGGTKIEGILTDNNYQTIERKRISTNKEQGYDSILISIKNPTYKMTFLVRVGYDDKNFVGCYMNRFS